MPSRKCLILCNGSGFQLPPARLLNPPAKTQSGPSKSILEDHARQLENVLSDFSVNGTIADVRYGPVVTRYDLNPCTGHQIATCDFACR
jgi:S-DNA-T family DNA segregation ATPase FtsK/SpoIIIE